MIDVALSKCGARISLSTSYDENFPPENIIDGNGHTFWSTTGMFPQEFIISFPSLAEINAIKLISSHVKQLTIEKSSESEPSDFQALSDHELGNVDGQLQMEDLPRSMAVMVIFRGNEMVQATSANHLRFIIKSGYDHFAAVYQVKIDGSLDD